MVKYANIDKRVQDVSFKLIPKWSKLKVFQYGSKWFEDDAYFGKNDRKS